MSNKKTTIVGLIIGGLLAAWGVFQPALTGNHVDWTVLIPAAIIAVVMYLQKDTGNWQTTTVGIVLSALLAGASAYQNDPNQWFLIAGAILSAIGGAVQKDHNAESTPVIKTAS